MAEALHVTELKSEVIAIFLKSVISIFFMPSGALSTLEESNQSLEEELANSQRCLEVSSVNLG